MGKKIKNLSLLKWKSCQHALQFENSCLLKSSVCVWGGGWDGERELSIVR